MNKKIFTFLLLFFLPSLVVAQLVTTEPEFPTADNEVTIYFDATEGNGELEDYDGDVYAHTGVITEESSSDSDWKYVIADWEENTDKALMEEVEPNLYRLEITSSIREFYEVPEGEEIQQMAFVFRSSDGSLEGKTENEQDIFAEVYESSFNVRFEQPEEDPYFLDMGESTKIVGTLSSESTDVELELYIDDQRVEQVNDDRIEYTYNAQNEGTFELRLEGSDGTETTSRTQEIIVNPEINEEQRPDNLQDGITYVDDSTVRFSLFAPHKEFVYLIGDFNDWEIDSNYFMNRETVNDDSTYYWIEIDGLSPGQEYGFQYLVDGELRIADPYSEKILDENDDPHIPSSIYPNLKSYPEGETEFQVGVIQPGKEEYEWQTQDYERPEQEKLVTYELLIRDFLEQHDFETLTDTLGYFEDLGVNAIELMPVMEFEGNISWGYNPSFLFATDKYYGPAEDLKKFIDEAHSRDIAVILDIVLNHVYGQSPLVRLWNEGDFGQPTAQNPYLNIESPNQEFSWGYDFNHESQATQYYIDRVTRYWLEEFNADGFRFDFTKGFTQNSGSGWERDNDRIRILKRMADKQWEVDNSSYVILEHFTENSEEQELSDYGMIIWGNVHGPYGEATMGYHSNDDSNFSGVYHGERGWEDPHLVGYMESHDEERLMYQNLTYGNSNSDGSYDIRELETALERNKLAAAFFFPLPGPKLFWQFGELGYDVNINRCEDGSTNNDCRTAPKPIRWEYYDNEERKKLFNTYKELLRLRNEHPAFTSEESEVSMDLSDPVKEIEINHPDLNVTITGNFGVETENVSPSFAKQNNDIYYEFFSGDSVSTSQAGELELGPGELLLYTSEKLEAPEENPLAGGTDSPGEGDETEFELQQNYPNPFNESTTIPYELPENAEQITLTIFDVAGRKIESHDIDPSAQGTFEFQAKNLASGMYFYRMEVDGDRKTKKMILIK